MRKLELRKELKDYYRESSKKPNIVDIPEGKFITIIGRGAPGGADYHAALNAFTQLPTPSSSGVKPMEAISLSCF